MCTNVRNRTTIDSGIKRPVNYIKLTDETDEWKKSDISDTQVLNREYGISACTKGTHRWGECVENIICAVQSSGNTGN